MKEIIRQLILSFHETPFRELMPRMVPFTDLGGKVTVVVGMRRAGKTSYCLQNLETFLASVPKERMLYLNFENIRLLEFTWKDFPSITDVYYGMFPGHKNQLCYFVFDEIQRIDHWESFIRGLLDEENVRVVLTGSSSKLLSTEIATSLRGRALTTEIFPFSFADDETRKRELNAFKSVAPELRNAKKVVVTWDEEGREDDIEIVPVWKFLRDNNKRV